MQATTSIVVFDPRGPSECLLDGEIVRGAREAERLARAGVALLPYDESRRDEPGGGYARAGYGDGWKVTGPGAVRVCPLLLRVTDGPSRIHWVAYVRPGGPNGQGNLRLVLDSSRGLTMGAGLSTAAARQITPGASEQVLGDSLSYSGLSNGFVGLHLYAVATDISIVAVAVSQTPLPR